MNSLTNKDTKTIVITGANRGLGLGAARMLGRQGHKVILTARDPEKGEQATKQLTAEGMDALFHQLDVTDQQSVDALIEWIRNEGLGIDVLINNAGIMIDGKKISGPSSVLRADFDEIRRTMEVNVYGAIRVANAIIPLMKEQGGGVIVNVSSGLGRLSDMSGGQPGYRISKTGINAVTRMLASELAGAGILVNSASPGWVRTDMGGSNATRSIEQGVDTIVWLATLPPDGPTGRFFHDREPTDW